MTLTVAQQRNQEIAATILQQLGGRGRIIAMIGAKNFAAGDSYLSFQFPKGPKQSINAVKIALNGNDEYDVTFYAIRGTKFKDFAHTGIGAENLKSFFQNETGLLLSLR